MEAPKPLFQILLLFLLVSSTNAFIRRALAEGVTPEEARQLRDEVTPVESLSSPFPKRNLGFFFMWFYSTIAFSGMPSMLAVSLAID
jgi:hypothetical protein